jgi:hypothetical protein
LVYIRISSYSMALIKDVDFFSDLNMTSCKSKKRTKDASMIWPKMTEFIHNLN